MFDLQMPTLRRLARPAGLEPATLGLEVRRKQTTGGSRRPLLPCLRGVSTAAGNPNTPAAATDCLPFVSRGRRCCWVLKPTATQDGGTSSQPPRGMWRPLY